jgi:hypothetical protein
MPSPRFTRSTAFSKDVLGRYVGTRFLDNTNPRSSSLVFVVPVAPSRRLIVVETSEALFEQLRARTTGDDAMYGGGP